MVEQAEAGLFDYLTLRNHTQRGRKSRSLERGMHNWWP
jgi:hypothetical protein